jgi:hypothetical protein
MWALVVRKLETIYQGHYQTALEFPVLFTLYIVPFVGLAILSVWLVWRGEARRAFWCLIGTILVDFLFSWGDDTFTHVYRIAALSDQIRTGAVSALLTNPNNGETLPTFVYYSEIPYLVPTLLNLLGLPALYAFKLVMCLHFIVLGYGLQLLIERTAPANGSRMRVETDYLVAFLFMSANYVYSLWFARGSLGELWVYCLLPWVVLGALSPNGRVLTAVLFLQICGHPIVMAQTLVAELLVAYTLTGLTLVGLIRRGFVPMVIAMLLAAPFWVPQSLWQGLILGPHALPADFRESFMTIAEMVSPRNERTMGVWLPLAVLLLVFVTRARLSLRVWVPAIAGFAIMALQTVYLFDVAKHIPTLALSLFVWRLALPVAFLLFGALLVGWREAGQSSRWVMVPLSAASAAGMMFLMLELEPNFVKNLTSGWEKDRTALVEYDRGEAVWGVREYLPSYAALSRNCDTPGARRATYPELRAGMKADARFVVVRRGPVGLVEYSANGGAVQLSACNEDLVLGPVEPGAVVAVSEARTNWLNYLRAIGFFVSLALIWWAIPFRRLSVERQLPKPSVA